MDMVFSCRTDAFFQASIKLAQPFPAQNCGQTKFTDTRAFLISVVFVKSTELQNIGLATPRLRITLKSEKLEKAVTVDFEKHPRTEGRRKVQGSVDPIFAAGLPFPVPKILEFKAFGVPSDGLRRYGLSILKT